MNCTSKPYNSQVIETDTFEVVCTRLDPHRDSNRQHSTSKASTLTTPLNSISQALLTREVILDHAYHFFLAFFFSFIPFSFVVSPLFLISVFSFFSLCHKNLRIVNYSPLVISTATVSFFRVYPLEVLSHLFQII